MTYYTPDGKDVERKMQNVLKRREKWLLDEKNAAARGCVILVNPKDGGWAFWLKNVGFSHIVSRHASVPPAGCVAFVDSAEVTDEKTAWVCCSEGCAVAAICLSVCVCQPQ